MRRVSAKAFTLIEMLVVVVIIAMLLAILLPSLAQARAQAKTVVCLTRVRSLAQAHLVYSESYRRVLPELNRWLWDGTNGSSSRAPYCPRSGELFGERYDDAGVVVGRGTNYVHFEEVFVCPMDSLQRRDVSGYGTKAIRPPRFSYARNKMVYQTLEWAGKVKLPTLVIDGEGYSYLPLDLVRRSADTPLMLEEHELSGMNDGWMNYNDWDQLTLRHSKKAMIGYYDGHGGRMDAMKYNEGSTAERAKLVAPGITY